MSSLPLSLAVAGVQYCKCCSCGVEFASPVLATRRDDGDWFFCPNGHRQHFTETTDMLLRRENQRLMLERNSLQSELRTEREARKWAKAEARRNATMLKTVKARVANGVCPCCNRHFTNLERHMESKHPKFQPMSS